MTPMRLFATMACGLFLMLPACKKPVHPACKKDKHCNVDEGEKCVDGLCQNCTTDEDCAGKVGPNGEALSVCFEFRCSDPATVGGSGEPGAQGSPCDTSDVCQSGLVCREGICDVCTDDFECDGGTCDLGSGLCSTGGSGTCSTDDDCAMDEICDAGMCVFSGDYGSSDEVLCDLQAVFFDFDSPGLRQEVQDQLKAAAQCMADQGRAVILEAHADPRGTEEYNILLTDKRGQSVKTFLEQLGVQGGEMTVISKGALESTGTDESSWQQDRRVEFIWQ
jgi:peptidoglycan-associated lipoprotein